MFQSKLFNVFTIFLFISVVAMLDCAVAGEKTKWHGTGITTNFQQIEVGDDKGHVLAISEAKQVFINDETGEKMVSISKNTIDLNPKVGQVTVKGYGVTTDPNGDKLIRAQEGKAIGKGHMKGTFTYVKGTGKYKDVAGGGTWESWSLAPQVSYYEVVGDLDNWPKQ